MRLDNKLEPLNVELSQIEVQVLKKSDELKRLQDKKSRVQKPIRELETNLDSLQKIIKQYRFMHHFEKKSILDCRK